MAINLKLVLCESISFASRSNLFFHQLFRYYIFCTLLVSISSTNGILLPKRFSSQNDIHDEETLNLPKFSNFQLDETFNTAKDIVVQKRKFENELVQKGKCFILVFL